MPHLKCVTCRTRSYTPGGGAAPVDALCPSCGSAFEPAGALSELVGFRVITSREGSGPSQAFIARLGDHLDRRAREADGGGTAPPEAVAVAVAVPSPPHPGT